ncbi:MAG: GAF domain-containing sensor histidine kinase [Candidatus Heimdallarchaeota archaeon]|nr:GAF domain-containing sensor histidine kinase [Candidatus Heimdallarchaeota archaeon]
MQPSWVPALRAVADSLQLGQDQIDLLRQIDKDTRLIMENKSDLESLVIRTIDKLTTLCRASAGHFFLTYDGVPSLIHSTNIGPGPTEQDLGSLLRAGKDTGQEKVIHLQKSAISNLVSFASAESVLLSLVDLPDPKSAGLIVLESQAPHPVEPFGDPSIRLIVNAVTDQLQNTFRFNAEWNSRDLTARVLTLFIEHNLKPSECLRVLGNHISSFLPSFGPLKIDPPPQVQILFYSEGDLYLTIRASTGEEPDITRVKVDESVCGYLVEDRSKPYILCNPETEPRYRWYLGQDQKKKMRSELAIPVNNDGSLIAILNLESEYQSAFGQQHIDSALQTAEVVGPWIAAIRERMEIGWVREEALSTIMDEYVKGFSKMLRHNAGNAANALVAQIEEIGEVWGKSDPELGNLATSTLRTARKFGTILDEFVEDTADASLLGAISIKSLINDAIDLLRDLKDAEVQRQNVEIDEVVGEDFEIYGSKILKQHLFNLLNNSIFWLNDRLDKRQDPPGKIEIQIRHVVQGGDLQEKEFNEKCEISIRDNGSGVSKKTLEKLRDFEVGFGNRPGGSGYGLWALRQYLGSIGGWIELDSLEGEGFEVKLLLDIHKPEIHNHRREWIVG